MGLVLQRLLEGQRGGGSKKLELGVRFPKIEEEIARGPQEEGCTH